MITGDRFDQAIEMASSQYVRKVRSGILKWLIGIPVVLFMLAISAIALVLGSASTETAPSASGFVSPFTSVAVTPEWLAVTTPVAAMAFELGWRGPDLIDFVAIVGAESSYNPYALGDTFPIRGLLCPSHGLAQIRSCPGTPNGLDRGPREVLIDPRANLTTARRLWLSPLNRAHWSVWLNLRYRTYLPLAIAATEAYR